MRLPFFTSFIIFVVLTNIFIFRSNKRDQKKEDDFWSKELEANSTRRKSLDNLSYIKIPVDKLPFGKLPDNDEVLACEKVVRTLSERKVVNLTGITNTDLKLEYGAPNITELTTYDQNYTQLVTSLQKWGKELYDAGLYEDAAKVLEFSVSTRTDVTATYRLLCDMYTSKLGLSLDASKQKKEALLPVAESLNSLSKGQIVELINSAV